MLIESQMSNKEVVSFEGVVKSDSSVLCSRDPEKEVEGVLCSRASEKGVEPRLRGDCS